MGRASLLPAAILLRFWTMLAHYHGGIRNAAEAARSLGVSEPPARRYLALGHARRGGAGPWSEGADATVWRSSARMRRGKRRVDLVWRVIHTKSKPDPYFLLDRPHSAILVRSVL
jgi:hypothetical protein